MDNYYEQKRRELQDLLDTAKNELRRFEEIIKTKNRDLRKAEKELENKAAEKEAKAEVLSSQLATQRDLLNADKEAVDILAKQRQMGYPFLEKVYTEYFGIHDKKEAEQLATKKFPAKKASEIVKKERAVRRAAEARVRTYEYLIEYYEHIAPFLIDLKDEVDTLTEEDLDRLEEYSEEELEDAVTNFLTKDEYRALSRSERNQLALDRFWKRPKSKWYIGKLYERYVGYLYEKDGYKVTYEGIAKGLEDLGRDLICQKGDEIIVVQCKNWSQFRTIYEKHIFQFFGTVFKYRDENADKYVRAVFYTSTTLSDLARRFAHELHIELKENEVFDKEYPSIKCNISRVNGEKIYHLPFDQQYDNTVIEPDKGEFYCKTVAEAEEAGFRRAFRWMESK